MGLFKKDNKGFTLLFAVLTASVLLSLALAIFNQIYKSLLLSSASKESLAAFYAADSGVECVFYWDLKHSGFDYGIFATSSASVLYNGGEGITCNSRDFPSDWSVVRLLSSATTEFNLSFVGGSFPTEGCSEVMVSKVSSGGNIFTTVESRGYNICDANSPRKVERAIRVTY
ncbi:MAG: hypothetical protein CEO19_480 [Parcubacteria group bacterium Gr01-1014_73]|nr:MAG: hypothetical protein CEO19_480 [Parcubacteria group bacterium Gr01-1014_73]